MQPDMPVKIRCNCYPDGRGLSETPQERDTHPKRLG